ncbi:MAG: SiaC family regulatory phosphoprotein [Bacteroidota bacterium]
MNTITAGKTAKAPNTGSLKAPKKTFQIQYSSELNLVSVRGWSITDTVAERYSHLLSSIEKHLEKNGILTLHFRYETFNGTTVKYLFKILKVMNKAHAKGQKVKIYWSCLSSHESDMIDMGLDLSKMCDFDFNISYL